MSRALGVIFVAIFLISNGHYADCQLFNTSSNATLADVGPSIAADLITSLIDGTVQLLGNCSNSNNASQTQFWLYTRQNPNNAIVLTSWASLNTSKPTKILIHGWGGNANIYYIRVIIDAYLQVCDCNIISVDYSVYVNGDYQTAFCYVPAVAQVVADFIYNMSTQANVSTATLHVVGHSLGGQVAGVAGYLIQQKNVTINRVTGLDPAGPLFLGISVSRRLTKYSATIVDVIHTNQGGYGYLGDCGSADFYPNGGVLQPGCVVYVLSNITNSTPLTYITCNHQRSCYLFAESIIRNSFCSVGTCSTQLCLFNTYAYMGEYFTPQPPSDEYFLTTNANSPYGRGGQTRYNCLF